MIEQPRLLTRAAILAGVLLAAAGILVAPVAATAGAAPVATAEDPAISAFAGCLRAGAPGDLLLLVDSSGSLGGTNGTDTANGRVTAANYLIDELTDYAKAANVKLDSAVASFDSQYRPVLGWTPMTASGSPVLHAAVNRLAAANTGFETDYVSALEGARLALRAQASSSGAKRCQAVVWFTDGKYEIDPRLTDGQQQAFGTTKPFAPGVQLTDQAAATTAQALGQTALCRSGGTADQLRADGVVTFAIGLAADNAPDAFGLMRQVAIGGTGCGALGSTASGDFHRATDINSLLFAFDSLTPGAGAPQTAKVCQDPARCQQVHSFVLDDSIQQVRLLGTAQADGIEVYVQAPGEPAAVKLAQATSYPQTLAVGKTQASYSWPTPRTVSLTITRPAGAGSWVGLWKVEFVDPTGTKLSTVSQTQLHILSDLAPKWVNSSSQPRSGDPKTAFRFGLTRSTSTAGIAVKASGLASSVVLRAQLQLSGGTRLPFPVLTGSQIDLPQTLDLSKASPGAATLHLQLEITTADVPAAGGHPAIKGTRLADSVVDLPLRIAVPVDFPSAPDRLDLGTHDAGKSFTASVPLTGGGCAYLGKVAVQTQPAAAATTITSPSSSVATCSAANGSGGRAVELTIATHRSQPGSVNATLVVHLLSTGTPRREITKLVLLTGDLQQPANATTRWSVFAATLAIGLLVPLLLLYCFNWLTSKIPGTRQILYGSFNVQVIDGDVRRDGAGLSVSLSDVAKSHPVPVKGTRSLQIDGLLFKARVGWNPLRPGIVQVSNPGGLKLLTSADRPSMAEKGQLPLTIHQSWVAAPSPDGRMATVLVVLSSDATEQVAQKTGESVRDQLPGLMKRTAPASTGGPSAGAAPPAEWSGSAAPTRGSDWTF